MVRPVPVEPALTVELTGSVRMDRRVRVASEVVGRVVWVSPEFRNGGSLAAKETFIRVDPAEYELEVKAAEHALREARARVWIETSRGRQSAESFALAHPGEEVPDFARNAPSIEKAEAQVMKARVALGLARLRLERTRISLPFDVRVVRSDVAVGELVGPAELVGPSSRLGVVYRPASIEVDAPIEPRDLEYLAPAVGRSAEVRARGRTWPAEVVRVSPVVSPKTRLTSLLDSGTSCRPGARALPDARKRVGGRRRAAFDARAHERRLGSRRSTRARASSLAPCPARGPALPSLRRTTVPRSSGAWR